ncbi:MAG: cell division protein FtsL, partial [Alphaproteobacteria bacterium]|nr:cell division protein FtsL [Alphaproteobacteria bacterium]
MKRWFDIVAIVLIVVLAVGLYRAKLDADAARVRIERLEREVAEARDQVRTLAAEAAYLSAPDRIETLARQKLGLTPATPAQAIAPDAARAALDARA